MSPLEQEGEITSLVLGCTSQETGMLNGLSFGRSLATCVGEVEGGRERIKLFSLLGLQK